MKRRVQFIIAISVIVLATIIGYQVLSYSRSHPSTDKASNGEQLNIQGARRPSQYLHICDTDNDIEYVSQGTPKCLGNDTYSSDYDPSVPGTVFSSPCKTTSGDLRYVYISNDENCPNGTSLLFYNTLGDSSGSSSDPTITNDSTTNAD